ncbi:MAG: PDZ domain-containing protein [Pirellulaceae bacterium]
MKLQAHCYLTVLLAMACSFAVLSAQDQPANPKIQEYEQSLEKIHAQASNVNQWHSKHAEAWSERQCRSCHGGTHDAGGGLRRPRFRSQVFAEEYQLLLSTATVANSLGIEAAPLDSTLRAHLNIDEKAGLVLVNVPEGSEGAKAGLKQHDVVLNVDQHQVNEPAKFNELVGGLQGKKASIGVLRAGKPLSVEVAVPQLPLAVLDRSASIGVELSDWGAASENRYRLGVTLSEADDTLRSHLKLAAGEGLVVTEVVDESPAAKMGVKQHDVLTELDGKRLTSVDGVNAQIQEIQDKTVVLKLLRSGQEVTCQIAPKKSSERERLFLHEVVLQDQTHHPAIVRWIDVKSGKAVEAGEVLSSLEPASDAAAQLAELKKQLAELGKTVEKLEAVIAPPAPPAEEKKPEAKKPEENPEKK